MYVPTDLSTILVDSQNPSIDVSELYKIRQPIKTLKRVGRGMTLTAAP